MSKYIKATPLERVERIAVVFGGGRSLSQIKEANGCDCLSVSYEDEDVEEGAQGGTGEPSSWAAEAWAKVVAAGIFDGTDSQGAVTRERLAVVLERRGKPCREV